MVLPYDNNLESICRQSASILQELAAQVREAGEPISWGLSDERVEEFFKCVAYPSPEHGKIAERRAKWMQVMHFNLELLAGSESDLGKNLLSSHMATLWSSILTPHVFWSEEAREMDFPHLYYSWHASKPWMEAIRQACDPREFLLFLPLLTSTLRDAVAYMHKCACIVDAMEGMESAHIASGGSTTGPTGPAQPPKPRSCRQTMIDVLEHSLCQAAASFGCLKRRNVTFLVDVISFIKESVTLAIYMCHQVQPCALSPPPLQLFGSANTDAARVATLGGLLQSALQKMTASIMIWLQNPSEAVPARSLPNPVGQPSSTQPGAGDTACPLMATSHECKAAQVRESPEQPAAPLPEVPFEARRRVLCSMLQALAVLAGMRGLGDVLARVQSHVLGSVVMALQRLGLQDFVSADWQALSTEPESSGSNSDTEDSPGHKAGVAACAKELSGRLKVGAAVASMLQLDLLKSASTGSPSAQAAAAATGSFSAAHGPAALLRAACAACMTVVADANEATSLAELENAFWVVDTACALAAELPQEVVPRAAFYTHSTSTAAATSSDLAAAVNGPGSSRPSNQEALRCQQQDGVDMGGAAASTGTEHMLACARAAHDAMVRHSDQGVCMSALKALKGVGALLEDEACVSLHEELLCVDMPQVKGQVLHILQQRMQRLPVIRGKDHSIWDSGRVGRMVVADMLRVASTDNHQSTDDSAYAFIRQDGFEDPLVTGVNILRHHVMRRSVSGSGRTFSQGFVQALRRWHVADAQDDDPEGSGFARAFHSRMLAAQRFAETHVGTAELPASLVVHACEALLEELQCSTEKHEI